MFRLDTMQTGGAGAAATLKLSNFPEGFVCAGILMRFAYPIAVSGASTAPSLNTLMSSLLGQFTLRDGATGQITRYPTVPGVEMRDVARFVTRTELPNNLSSLSWNPAVPPVTNSVLVDLFVPFAVEELTDGRIRCPGWTQMRTMIIDLTEGTAWSAVNQARGSGNMLVDVDVLCYPSELDRSGPILSYFRANQASLKDEGPDGALLGAWEASAAQASTAIQLFSLSVSARKIAGTVPPYVAGDKYLLNWDTGITPITDRVTMAFSPDEGQSSGDLPSGLVLYEQASQYVSTLQLRGLYWPPLDVEEAMGWTRLAAGNGPVLGALPEIANIQPGNIARTLPIEFHTPNTPGFTLTQGLLAPDKGAQPYAAVPASVSATHGAIVDVAATSGAETQVAAQSKQLDVLSRRIPGLAQLTHGNTQTKASTDPMRYVRALESVAGNKGKASIDVLKRSMKVS
jgi:hypothetical protein